MSDLRRATRRMLVALDHYWEAYEIDGNRMQLWWGAFERERAKVDVLLADPSWCKRPKDLPGLGRGAGTAGRAAEAATPHKASRVAASPHRGDR